MQVTIQVTLLLFLYKNLLLTNFDPHIVHKNLQNIYWSCQELVSTKLYDAHLWLD